MNFSNDSLATNASGPIPSSATSPAEPAVIITVAVLSIIGNLLVIVVTIRRQTFPSASRLFIASMACSDLILGSTFPAMVAPAEAGEWVYADTAVRVCTVIGSPSMVLSLYALAALRKDFWHTLYTTTSRKVLDMANQVDQNIKARFSLGRRKLCRRGHISYPLKTPTRCEILPRWQRATFAPKKAWSIHGRLDTIKVCEGKKILPARAYKLSAMEDNPMIVQTRTVVSEYTHFPTSAGATMNGTIKPSNRSEQAMEAMKSLLAEGNVCRLMVTTMTRGFPTMDSTATVMMTAGSAGDVAEEGTGPDALVARESFEKFISLI
uniref:G-protein coupled receptors family 1 profile domain-containing protein n=1 Tax=Branchiostoma floridae TaxID=7739 RepID=C3ZS85_BRAFL|eukprot:XP_002588606.1 hypothetical protein BRAFLDRAFT_107513 [Branchiostoma floridae]